MSDESEHSESEFYYLGELSDAELLQSPTHSESTERKSTPLTTEEAHNFLRSQQQANRQSRKQLFRMNCPIINLRNKQTVLRRKFFQKSRIHRGSKARNRPVAKKTKYDINVFFEFSTSALFEEAKLSTNKSSKFTVQFIQIIKVAYV